ncbi:MAG: glycosyltransferase family 4 protein [Bacteroidaceae bacterium]|nr:glycosyltransferase family 4 protein [Bacteroidaceae bacterium]
MKTILYVNHTSVVGGASYAMLRVIKEVDRSLYKPIVLLKQNGPLYDEIKSLGIEVYTLPSMTAVPYNISLLKYKSLKTWYNISTGIKDFEKWLDNHSIDIIYINSMMLYPYLAPAKKKGIKTIIHIREHWPENENRMQLGWAKKAIISNADSIIAINKYSASMFAEAEGKVSVVYDWIDFTDRYEPHPLKAIFGENCDRYKVFLYTGGMQKIKGTYEIVETFSKHIKGDDYRLLIVGCSKQKEVRGIKGKAKQFLSKIGYKSFEYKVKDLISQDYRIECIPSVYKIKDIIEQAYCVVSYFTKPHANLILAESIILKKVVIAAETPESLEYSNNGELALLFPYKDKKAYIERLQNVGKEYERITEILNKKSQIIATLFNKERNVNIISQIYKKL